MTIKFGIVSTDIEACSIAMSAALGVEFVRRYSDFRGGNYSSCEDGSITMFLQTNFDQVEQEQFEDAWPPDQLVLYLDGRGDDQAWSAKLDMLRAALGVTMNRLP